MFWIILVKLIKCKFILYYEFFYLMSLWYDLLIIKELFIIEDLICFFMWLYFFGVYKIYYVCKFFMYYRNVNERVYSIISLII